jgi:hypothetical protein
MQRDGLMPTVHSREMRRADLLIQRCKLVLRPANMGVPFGVPLAALASA